MEYIKEWETIEPLATPHEVLDFYIKNINMLDIVRRTPYWFEGGDVQGIHYKITPRAFSPHTLYSHRVDVLPID